MTRHRERERHINRCQRVRSSDHSDHAEAFTITGGPSGPSGQRQAGGTWRSSNLGVSVRDSDAPIPIFPCSTMLHCDFARLAVASSRCIHARLEGPPAGNGQSSLLRAAPAVLGRSARPSSIRMFDGCPTRATAGRRGGRPGEAIPGGFSPRSVSRARRMPQASGAMPTRTGHRHQRQRYDRRETF
jgi:hypothetical protein